VGIDSRVLENGYSQTELGPTADWGYYIRERDDDRPVTTRGRRTLMSKSGTVKSNEGHQLHGETARGADEL
jgi:hypothetical protein